MEAAEVVVLARDSWASGRVGVEEFSIDPFRRVYAALDHRNAFLKDVVDVGAGLGPTPLIEVADGVVVGVSDVVLCPVLLDDAVGVLFIALIFRGIFYCCHAAK